MNKELQEFARAKIKEGLKNLPQSSRNLFKRIYSPDDHDLDIDTVVDNMAPSELDWAMQQVSRTKKK